MTPTPEGREDSTQALVARVRRVLDARKDWADETVVFDGNVGMFGADPALHATFGDLRALLAALSVPAPEPVAFASHREGAPILPNGVFVVRDGRSVAETRAKAEENAGWCRTPDTEYIVTPLYAAAPRERTEGEDSARLDWLERQARERESLLLGWNRADGDHNEFTGASCDWPESFFAIYEDQEGQPYATLRSAIDAARTGGSDVR